MEGFNSMYNSSGSSNSFKKGNTNHKKHKLIFAAALIFISASAGFVGGWIGSANRGGSAILTTASQGRRVAEEQSTLISTIAKEVGPSVVSVSVVSRSRINDPFFGPQTSQQESAGTGFIISGDGHVVTNRHVIPSGTTAVSLTMSDGTVLDDVEVIGKTSDGDPLDVAFLKINDSKGQELQPAVIGNSSDMQVGDIVIAIGNALGQFQNTVTSGIISGYGRSVEASDARGRNAESLQNLFQTDAAINQGNSGGPLVNANGEVIGINTAVAGGSAQNIGFAIPIDDARGLINSVLSKGSLERPYIGVRYVQLTPGIAQQLEIDSQEGAYIDGSNGSGVVTDSPASRAGLMEGDVVIRINDQVVDSENTLSSVVGRFNVGDTVKVVLIRDGTELTVDLTIGAMPTN